jgi:hypothetical protein
MLTVTRDAGLCVLHSTSSRSTLELTLDELRELLSHPILTRLDAIRGELRAYESAESTCERASERSQRVAEQCRRDSIDDPEPAPETERTPKGPVS